MKPIHFEVIGKAVAGEAEEVDTVLQHYTEHIEYRSTYQGHHINDDIQDRLKAKPVEALLKLLFIR